MSTEKPNVSKGIIDRLKALDDLPHFPDALVKLERAVASDEPLEVQDIVQLIAQDPRLAAGLIGVVNTAKYTTGVPISDLSEAIVRVGINDVRVMAHAINYKSSFKSKPPFSEKHFMKHAMLSAFIAQALAKSLHVNKGEAFLCGLMRDIGVYLLAVEDREKYLEVIKLADYDVSKLSACENKIFGTHHALMSARLLQQWKFPKEIIMGVAFHHTPEKAEEAYKAYAYLTFLSEQAVFRLGFDNGIADITEEEREVPSEELLNALEYFGLAIEVYDELIQTAYEDAENMGV
ncbi:HDOD domain-containing protein [Thiomicrorhabdus lithotrophica]|uniref:HDOD domain-containing protein n=1 Tax=Thiomicrorhabdus lithotrophica TaxID=2949997 RepID=A0ABY8C7M4_9GAMM|nr:HDOD domain-containing protein [Thiomicrorhabdus lithotrophica]WEJ61959.1 HDOD domain-containing protein [Thiomicrorhabdus lithotrophica]